jgi:pimeloyl-ACP methyl ester carboxylesterase
LSAIGILQQDHNFNVGTPTTRQPYSVKRESRLSDRYHTTPLREAGQPRAANLLQDSFCSATKRVIKRRHIKSLFQSMREGNAEVNPSAHQPPQMARANGIELCYETFGDPAAEPLILIMGLGAQMIQWDDDFCRQLAARGFRVIRFDNRDIGQSSRLSGGKPLTAFELLKMRFLKIPIKAPYLLSDMAQDTVGLMDTLGIASAHLVGASMGGMIAQEIAISFPQRVRSLTSIMSTTGNPKIPGPTREAMAVLMAPPPKSREEYIERYGKTWTVLRAGSFPEDEALDPARAERAFARGLNPAGVGRQLRAILASGSRKERLRNVKAPTLVIHGTIDPLVRPAGGRDTAASIPGAKLVMIEHMGHALPIPLWPQVIDAIDGHAHSASATTMH